MIKKLFFTLAFFCINHSIEIVCSQKDQLAAPMLNVCNLVDLIDQINQSERNDDNNNAPTRDSCTEEQIKRACMYQDQRSDYHKQLGCLAKSYFADQLSTSDSDEVVGTRLYTLIKMQEADRELKVAQEQMARRQKDFSAASNTHLAGNPNIDASMVQFLQLRANEAGQQLRVKQLVYDQYKAEFERHVQ